MLNSQNLVSLLLEAGLPPGSFQVPGVHTHDPLPTDFWFLRRGSDGVWEVGAYERGNYDVRKRFPPHAEADAETDADAEARAEGDAAAWMYQALTGREPPF